MPEMLKISASNAGGCLVRLSGGREEMKKLLKMQSLLSSNNLVSSIKFPLAVLLLILSINLPRAASKVFLWPMPQSVEWRTGSSAFLLSSDFHIKSPENPILQRAAVRFKELIFSERWLPIEASTPHHLHLSNHTFILEYLEVVVTDLQADLQHGVDESYSIKVPESELLRSKFSARITATTIWGALHGLETFSQIVRRHSQETSKLVIEHSVHIKDKPLFPHRGLMLDTARNFYPVHAILRTIRAMAHNKMNVFHWHITDSHSFPLELAKEPDLSTIGAYSARETYSRRDVKVIVEYARVHGVRVIPELDMPGHTGSWSGAYPEIVTCHDQFWLPPGTPWSLRMASEPGWPGQLNPLHSQTYKVVKNVVHEVALLFPDDFYHGGGDEVNPGCWEHSPDILEYVQAGGTLNELLERFVNKTNSYITAQKKTAIYWEDLVTDSVINVTSSTLPTETTIFQTWNGGATNTKILTSAGYRTIVSSSDFYYLDCGHGGWLGNDSRYDQQTNNISQAPFNYPGGDGGSWCGPFKTWARIYSYDITYNLSESEADLVLGGEVALWSEQSDATNLDSRLWPRTAAMAESLWSGNRRSGDAKKRYADALNRLNDWRFRLVERGINAEPLQPLWCLKHPGQCNLNA